MAHGVTVHTIFWGPAGSFHGSPRHGVLGYEALIEQFFTRRFTSNDPRSGNLLSASVSYIPKAFVEANPAILDERNEPWPGGTLHQLSTVGIEIMNVVDEVTARMPSSTEAQEWDLPPGIPLLFCRRLSYDGEGVLIEISDAWYPADRTELRFVTPLKPWPYCSEADGTNVITHSG